MFKNLWKYFKNDPSWKNIMKVNVCLSFGNSIAFLSFLILLILVLVNNWTVNKGFYWFIIFIFQSCFISYSLSIFVVNSNEIQQQKYRFLWLFLYFLGLNPLGIISILLLMKKQKKKNDVIAIKETSQMIKTEKWFMLWAIYTSIVMMICIVTIPLSIINLINIKKNWKKEEINIKELKKIAYFSSDWTLMLANKFAF
ncbi:hypothetical protein [Spiroplasma endosymbiont of Polydrusus pterygomalis]|uniref:hypothetical protein n=1 Tax=Spiroplasma endosymbiont of Polydrusus pterygomalis TaxID=3139327 RepID=UPI003CCB5D76